MGRIFSRDDVLRLAPDASSAKSGQDLAQVRKWTMLAGDEVTLWGQCQGSGSKPYQVQIDLSEPAFKCSCPSHKFPCKHGLGLLLIYASSPEAIVFSERPAWVSEWLAGRQTRASRAAEKKASDANPRDPEVAARRRQKRIDSAREGLAGLSAWMCDLVRGGIGTVPGKGFEFFDSQARRMVDAQIPGVARLLRELGSLSARGASWQRPFVEQLSRVHLLARAVERFDELPQDVRADVESVLGVTTTADELNSLPAVTDRWQATAQTVESEDRLRVQRTWLYGVQSQRPALVLQFAHGQSAFEGALLAGTEWEGELVFFPGNGPRAAVRSAAAESEPLDKFNGCTSIDELLDRYSQALAAFPWLDRLCLPLMSVVPTKVDEKFWILDQVGAALPARLKTEAGFKLLAISGGQPVEVAAEFDGQSLWPLSVVAGGRWASLSPIDMEEGG